MPLSYTFTFYEPYIQYTLTADVIKSIRPIHDFESLILGSFLHLRQQKPQMAFSEYRHLMVEEYQLLPSVFFDHLDAVLTLRRVWFKKDTLGESTLFPEGENLYREGRISGDILKDKPYSLIHRPLSGNLSDKKPESLTLKPQGAHLRWEGGLSQEELKNFCLKANNLISMEIKGKTSKPFYLPNPNCHLTIIDGKVQFVIEGVPKFQEILEKLPVAQVQDEMINPLFGCQPYAPPMDQGNLSQAVGFGADPRPYLGEGSFIITSNPKYADPKKYLTFILDSSGGDFEFDVDSSAFNLPWKQEARSEIYMKDAAFACQTLAVDTTAFGEKWLFPLITKISDSKDMVDSVRRTLESSLLASIFLGGSVEEALSRHFFDEEDADTYVKILQWPVAKLLDRHFPSWRPLYFSYLFEKKCVSPKNCTSYGIPQAMAEKYLDKCFQGLSSVEEAAKFLSENSSYRGIFLPQIEKKFQFGENEENLKTAWKCLYTAEERENLAKTDLSLAFTLANMGEAIPTEAQEFFRQVKNFQGEDTADLQALFTRVLSRTPKDQKILKEMGGEIFSKAVDDFNRFNGKELVILDTNILLHTKKLKYLFQKSSKIRLYAIPDCVMNELDGLKRGENERNQQARRANAQLAKLIGSFITVSAPKGGSVEDRILACAEEKKKSIPWLRNVLVHTSDNNMKAKATGRSIPIISTGD